MDCLINFFKTPMSISANLFIYTQALPDVCFPNDSSNSSRSVSPVAKYKLIFASYPLVSVKISSN